jgi:type I restriction enzyme M protein
MNNLIDQALAKGIISFDAEKKNITYTHAGKKYRYTDPEEVVRAECYAKLVLQYNYPPQRIALEVVIPKRKQGDFADIVIFEDDAKKTPYIVVECKKEEASEAEFKQAVEQGFGNAIPLSASYLWVTSQAINQFHTLKNFPPLERAENIIHDLPEYGKRLSQKPTFYKGGEGKHQLEILTEKALTDLFKKAHQALWDAGKRTPSEAFDELNKLIFCKIYDEKLTEESEEENEPYAFQIYPQDLDDAKEQKITKAEILMKRVQGIYEQGRKEDPEVFKDDIRISPAELTVIVGILAKTNLRDTDLDCKGRAFETFLKDDIFRGKFGQYFTPRSIIKFVVDVLPITHKSFVLDPSCGSGGFLLYALDKVRKQADKIFDINKQQTKHYEHWHKFAENNLFGIEISETIARVAKMNMIIHDDGHTNVIAHDGLESVEKIYQHALKNKSRGHDKFKAGVFDFIITNPPFGSDVKASTKGYLGDYDLGKKNFDWIEAKLSNVAIEERDSQKSEILFVEQYFEFLKTPTNALSEGGIVAAVVPDGILTNSSAQFVRDWIQEHCRIIAVVSIPQHAFAHTGAGVKSSVLFLQKYNEQAIEINKDIKLTWQNQLFALPEYGQRIVALMEEKQYTFKRGDAYIQTLQKELGEYIDALKDQNTWSKPLQKQAEKETNDKIKIHEKTEQYAEWRKQTSEEYNDKISIVKDGLQERLAEKLKEQLTNYPIFMAIAEQIGYDATGKEINRNDLDDIALALKEFIEAIKNGQDSFFV